VIPQTLKSFKLLTFWLLDPASKSHGWLKQKCIFFLGKGIVTQSPAAPIKLMLLGMSHPIISHSCLPILSCYSHPCCAIPVLNSMAIESASNLLPTYPSIDDDAGGDSRAESTEMITSSSPTCGASSLMVKGEIPEMTDFFQENKCLRGRAPILPPSWLVDW
jgi:hypothetical protein